MEHLAKNRYFRYGVLLLLGLMILYFLWLLRPLFFTTYRFIKTIIAPFAVAMIISYVLNPVVNMLSSRKVPRGVAVLLIYAFFLTSLGVVLMNIIPMLIEQLEELNEHLPEITMHAQGLLTDLDNQMMPGGVRSGMNQWFFQLENRISSVISGIMDNIGGMINTLLNIFIVPFLIFYILKDFDVFERAVVSILPGAHRKGIVVMLKEIDTALGHYIRGQFLVCVIMGALAYAGYMIAGMPYALLLASIVALFNIIPYLGPFLGAAPAVIMASTISMKMVIVVIIVNIVCQILESNVVSPQVVGRTLHLHPLAIIFALLVGGEVAGIPGLILAVPVMAVLKVVIQRLFAYYLKRKPV
ncbi:AI-2E family transporter [Paenibacillus sp. P96]|uniref:AI-2E family transporter n=1 Tax=Paenibacillus zeirhizosphaerae TaxID=2987519 RepID=A0ABT9FKG5_9BACL|nr:AI-2E family transporter [Paenibacillus sp. P96]MDP4095223.1 AI-2E family transporter [Paenibacillus sp. P96]